MKNKYLLLLVVIVGVVLVVVSCAPAPTPTPVPTTVPTRAAPPTVVSQPTTVPPTLAPQPTVAPPTVAPQPTVAPTTAPTTQAALSPTKAAVAGSATLAPTKATPTLVAGVPKSADDLQVISPELLKAMIEGGADIVIVDAQPKEAYALGHIKGAVNVPWDTQIKTTGNLPYNKLIVVYCACPPDAKSSETDAGDVGMQLVSNFQYPKVALLDGGWLRWQQLKYPAEPATK